MKDVLKAAKERGERGQADRHPRRCWTKVAAGKGSAAPAMIRRCLSILPLLPLVACAGAQTLGLHSAHTKAPVIAVFEQAPADAVDLGQVRADTCLNNFFDPRLGSEIGLDNLKIAAARMGANSVAGVTYEESNRLFCATGLKLTAQALVATAASIEELKHAPSASQKCDASGDLSDFAACKIRALPNA